MSTISAAAVNELRKRTDLPLMECKRALTEANGDLDKAIEILRSQFAKAAVKREGNEAAEGRVGIFVDEAASAGAILEMRCESAPSAKSDQFIALTNDLAKQIATTSADSIEQFLQQKFAGGPSTVQDRINETIGLIREKMVVHRFQKLSAPVFGHYVHHDGSVGVIISCSGSPKTSPAEPLRDISAHIAAMNPSYMTPQQVPAEVIDKEKTIAMQQIKDDPKNANKPANIIEKIAEGKLKTWLAENVLTEQPMANTTKYPNKTVGQTLEGLGLSLKEFVRYKVGATASA